MALNIENIVAELETATILELSELVKAIEEKFDVSAAAPVAVKELQQKNYKQKFKQQSVKRSLQHKEIATKNRIMYQLMIHWWQRYYKFTKTIQAKKAKNKSLVAVLMAAY